MGSSTPEDLFPLSPAESSQSTKLPDHDASVLVSRHELLSLREYEMRLPLIAALVLGGAGHKMTLSFETPLIRGLPRDTEMV